MNGKPDFYRKAALRIFLCLSLLFLPVLLFGQAPTGGTPVTAPASRLQTGVSLYGRGMWPEALAELRRAYQEGPNPAQKAEALYWIAMTELAAAHYEESIRAMDELQRLAPGNTRYAEIPYHRGRVYYYLGRHDEAIVLFGAFIDSIAVDVPGENARRPAALYWMGECLYALGQLDRAQDIFSLIVEQYPQSVKYEASSYRLALINQKKIETELLAILKWSHEESLKTVEEYQRRERSYDQAIIAYQRRIADLLQDNRLSQLETGNTEYRNRLAESEARLAEAEVQIAYLESLLNEAARDAARSPEDTGYRPGVIPAYEPAPAGTEPRTPLPAEVAPPTPPPLRSPLYPVDPVAAPSGAPVSQTAPSLPPAAAAQAAWSAVPSQAARPPAYPGGTAPGESAAALPPQTAAPAAAQTQTAQSPAPYGASAPESFPAARLQTIRGSAVDLITGLDTELQGAGTGASSGAGSAGRR